MQKNFAAAELSPYTMARNFQSEQQYLEVKLIKHMLQDIQTSGLYLDVCVLVLVNVFVLQNVFLFLKLI